MRLRPRIVQQARPARLLVLWLLLGGLLACDNDATPPGASDPAKPTIVSLTPAITQMLIDMGKQDHLVGVSSRDTAGLDLPACGDYNDPSIEKILTLAPDLVLTESSQAGRIEVPGKLKSYAERGAFKLGVVPHSESIADIQRALTDPEIGLGQAVGDPEAAAAALRRMNKEIELVHEAVKDAERPRVLMLIEPESLGAIGTGVTHAELLGLAGATNALASVDTGYLTLSRAQVLETARPDIVLIFQPGARPLADNDPRLKALKGLAVPAVTNKRIVVINHPQAMLPATSLPQVLVEMAAAIHPARAQAIRDAYERAGQLDNQDGGGP